MTHAFNMMTGFSTLPLQIASVIGFLFTFLGFLILLYVLFNYLTNGSAVPGFAFLASIIAIFSGAQLFALGIIGEYLARMHFRAMDRPTYLVREVTGRRMTADGSIRFEGHGAILECSLVPWDTEIFGFPVAQITRVELARARGPDGGAGAFDRWCSITTCASSRAGWTTCSFGSRWPSRRWAFGSSRWSIGPGSIRSTRQHAPP